LYEENKDPNGYVSIYIINTFSFWTPSIYKMIEPEYSSWSGSKGCGVICKWIKIFLGGAVGQAVV
jgi:hypothetical protein